MLQEHKPSNKNSCLDPKKYIKVFMRPVKLADSIRLASACECDDGLFAFIKNMNCEIKQPFAKLKHLRKFNCIHLAAFDK